MPVILVVIPIALTVLAGERSPAFAQGSLTLNPAVAEGVAMPGQRLGPFGIHNTTEEPYAIRVSAVLLGQNTDGGLFVRQDEASLSTAAQLLGVPGERRFRLPPGESRSVTARLRDVSEDANFYGGVLFHATPEREIEGTGVTPLIQLNARVLLRPPSANRRLRARLTGVRAEQAGPRQLRAVVELDNTGNVDVTAGGRIVVRDRRDVVRLRGAIEELDVLPGSQVELPVELRGDVLAAGRYEIEANVSVNGRDLSITRSLELFGPNEVASRQAEIVSFEPPRVEEGEEAQVSVGYANTGNVPFTPQAELSISGVEDPVALETTEVPPDDEAQAVGSVRLEGRATRELTVRLLVGDREVDTRSVSVTPAAKRSLTDRVSDWIAANAVVLVALLAAALLAVTVLLGVLVARRRSTSA